MIADLWQQFRSVVAADPACPAIIRGDTVLSRAGLAERAERVAANAVAAGLVAGDRCVVCAENAPDVAAVLLGLSCAGIVPAVVHAEAPASHFLLAAERTGARLAVVDEARTSHPAIAGVSTVTVDRMVADGGQAMRTRTSLLGTAPASIFFTSGSTGLPKGVAQSHASLAWGCEAVGGAMGLTSADRLLCAIPWAFDYGWGQLLSTLLLGVTHVLPDGRASLAICEAIERHRPTVLPGVPSLFGNMLRGVTPITDLDLSSIRLVTNTGSKIPPSIFDDMLAIFPSARVSLNYGLTETYRSATLPFSQAATHPDAVGYALPGAALAVIGEDGRECAAGEIGEIVHRGQGVFLGYWGEPEKTAEALRPDPLWLAEGVKPSPAVFTGDLGWKDDEGRLYIKGRRDRQIKSMGVRVSPDEVEQLIDATGLVAEIAIIARPHDIVGEQIVAVYSAKDPGADPVRDLKREARRTMSQFMQPMVWIRLDRLPRTASAKIDYPELRRLYGTAPA